jgi:oligoribonuclease
MTKHAKILWIDLEMTGLDPKKDRIVEIAAIITDWDFNEIAVFESGVGHDQQILTKRFSDNAWAAARPVETKALLDLSLRSLPETEVEAQLVSLLKAHFPADQPILLAGNSIHMDRRFIIQHMPKLDALLHYRMLDVSAWKVVFEGKYKKRFPKPEEHRALSDIRGSIMELKYYLGKVRAA